VHRAEQSEKTPVPFVFARLEFQAEEADIVLLTSLAAEKGDAAVEKSRQQPWRMKRPLL